VEGVVCLNPEQVKEIIETNGLKKYFVAAQAHIPYQRLSSYLSGKGTLSFNQEYRLQKYLESISGA